MTVYGLDYRPKPYEPTSALARLRPLAASECRALFRSKWGILLFAVCSLPTLVRLVFLLIYLGVLGFGGEAMRREMRDAPGAVHGFLPTRASFHVEPVVGHEWLGMLVFLVLTSLATARAIAKDRGTNALELYWTRGISPTGYFLGKLAGAFWLVSMLTVVAPVVLWLIGVVFADDWSFFTETAPFMPRVVLGLVVFTLVLTCICVLISAIAGSANVATILWSLLLVGSLAAANVLEELSGLEVTSWASVWDAAATLARACAGTKATVISFDPMTHLPNVREVQHDVFRATAMLLGLLLVLSVWARRKLRMVEAIG